MTQTASILKDIYSHCAEMQKLADTKNAGLIAFNGAVIIGMTKLSIDFWDSNKVLFICFTYVILMCLISIFVNMSALVAQLRHHHRDTMTYGTDNPLFFGKVSQMKGRELVDLIKQRYDLNEPTNDYECDLARQAIIMSQIAVRKYKLFNLAFFWTITGITTPIGALVFELFFNPNRNR
jgi:hypothetical protein